MNRIRTPDYLEKSKKIYRALYARVYDGRIGHKDLDYFINKVDRICSQHGLSFESPKRAGWKRIYSIEKHPEITLNFFNVFQVSDDQVDFSHDFFERQTNLTVSGQLEAELGATALG
ncbi:MAG: hypothetical protein KDB87_22020, partial [Flavobacteriales bacterium]|nr:hypothetical protein [Flavobacteriales bacterium]